MIAILPLIVALAGVDTYSNLYYWLFFVFPPYRFGEFLLHRITPDLPNIDTGKATTKSPATP